MSTMYIIEVYRPRVDGYLEYGSIAASSPEAAIEEYRVRVNDRTQRVRAVRAEQKQGLKGEET